jgi:hypothetical protein
MADTVLTGGHYLIHHELYLEYSSILVLFPRSFGQYQSNIGHSILIIQTTSLQRKIFLVISYLTHQGYLDIKVTQKAGLLVTAWGYVLVTMGCVLVTEWDCMRHDLVTVRARCVLVTVWVCPSDCIGCVSVGGVS